MSNIENYARSLKYHYKFTCNDCGLKYEGYENFLPSSCTIHNCRSKNIRVILLPKETNNETN